MIGELLPKKRGASDSPKFRLKSSRLPLMCKVACRLHRETSGPLDPHWVRRNTQRRQQGEEGLSGFYGNYPTILAGLTQISARYTAVFGGGENHTRSSKASEFEWL